MAQSVLLFFVIGSIICSVYSLQRGFPFTGPLKWSGLKLSTAARGKFHSLAATSEDVEQSRADRLQSVDDINKDADRIMKSIASAVPQLHSAVEHEDEVMTEKSIADTNWSGQSTMEVTRVSKRNWSDFVARSGLATVDVLALFTFAVIGRSSHNEHANLLLDLQTAAPFIASWCLLSPWVGAYTRESTASLKEIPQRLLPAWAVSIPTALAIRGLIKGTVPPTPFIIVSLVSTFIALWLFRSLYVLVAGDTSDAEQRSAGPLEVFTMIGTLLKRW